MSARACTTTSSPQVYFVPRAGTLHRVTAAQRDPLLALRTELELLRRVHRHAGQVRGASGAGTAASASQRFTDEDRSELADIVRDAGRAIVDEMIAVFDEEFPELRKEIVMSVVNEEAEKIVAAAESSGVLVSGNAAESATESDARPEPLSESLDALDNALAVAQSELAQIVGEAEEPSTTDPSASTIAPGVPVQSDVDLISEGAAECNMDDAQKELAEALADFSGGNTAGNDSSGSAAVCDDSASGPSAVETSTGADSSTEEVAALAQSIDRNPSQTAPTAGSESLTSNPKPAFTIQEVRTDEPAFADPRPASPASVRSAGSEIEPAPFDADYTPERVQNAIAAIEQGVRKLAALLSTEVNEQCHRAQEALADVGRQRDHIAEAGREAGTILNELRRLRDETLNTRDGLVAAAREARQCCEEARRGKNRADHSAAAAELAAEQASREVENARASSRA